MQIFEDSIKKLIKILHKKHTCKCKRHHFKYITDPDSIINIEETSIDNEILRIINILSIHSLNCIQYKKRVVSLIKLLNIKYQINRRQIKSHF